MQDTPSAAASAVIFKAPDAQDAGRPLTADEYIKAVAECVQVAASKGMCEPFYLTRPGKPRQMLHHAGPARDFVMKLVESDLNRREWMAVEMLVPELNHCISAIRTLLRREPYVQAERERLRALQGAVHVFGEPGPEDAPMAPAEDTFETPGHHARVRPPAGRELPSRPRAAAGPRVRGRHLARA